MGAGHSHGSHRSHRADRADHGARVEIADGPRWTLLVALALAVVAAVVGVVGLWPDHARVDAASKDANFAAPGVTFPTATVLAMGKPCASAAAAADDPCGRVRVRVADGSGRGDTASVQVSPQVLDSGLRRGDTVKLQRTPASEGADVSYAYFGTERSMPLLLLAVAFAGLVLVVARWRGLFALLGLGFSGAVLWWFMLPALLSGSSGLLVGLTTAAVIMVVVLYTTHGFSMRTSTALAGTLVGVLVTAGIGVLAAGATRLTGVVDEEAGILGSLVGDLSFQQLFACAAVVAGLGVLNDVTITQSSSVWEIRAAAPTMSRREVFASGMRIGRDHIASTIYTIVFAYAGTALAMLVILQLYGLPVGDLLTTEDITEEVVRTLASSIGLVLAVPLTTAIAAWVTVPRRSLS